MTIYLARHGETADNAAGRVQGARDTPLSDEGRRQARTLGLEAAPLGLRALYASQLARAYETAMIVGEALGLKPIVDKRLAESRRGLWEGRLIAEIERDEPEAYRAWCDGGPSFRFPGGESLVEHRDRVIAALEEIARGPGPALAVCHGGSIRCALAAPDLREMQAIPVPNGALIELPRTTIVRARGSRSERVTARSSG